MRVSLTPTKILVRAHRAFGASCPPALLENTAITAPEPLGRSETLLEPRSVPQGRSNELLEPCSAPQGRSKGLLEPRSGPQGRSKGLLEPRSGPQGRSKALLEPASVPQERSNGLLEPCSVPQSVRRGVQISSSKMLGSVTLDAVTLRSASPRFRAWICTGSH